MCDAGQFVDAEPPVQVVQRVPHGAADRVVGRRSAHRVLGELGLAALAVCGHDHAAGHARGDVGAVVLADEVQAGIDARGGSGGGDDRSVVDVEHRGVDRHLRMAFLEQSGVPPVRGRLLAVQQARGSQGERAAADGHHPRSSRGGVPQRVQDRRGDVTAHVRDSRDDDGVGAPEPVQSVVHHDVETAHDPVGPGCLRAQLEPVPPVHLQLRPGHREHLGDRGELERSHPVEGEAGDPVTTHDGILSVHAVSDTVGGVRQPRALWACNLTPQLR